ncbi:MAG: FecR domain-containing protein [Polyangiaceae bacterium]
MSDPHLDRLFEAWAESLARSQPALDPGVRSRVLAQHPQSGAPRTFPAPYRWGLTGFAVAVALAVTLILRSPSALTFQTAGRTGEVGAWLSAQPTEELALKFSEGTRVSLSKGSRGRVTQVTHGGAHIELADGSVEAEVTHAPGAAWSFDAGPFKVTVTGTKLDVSWAPDTGRFELSVSRGSVLVQGPFISQQQEVRAGQVCRVDLNHHLMELAQLADEALPPAQTTPSAAPPPSAVPNTAASATLPPTTSSASHALSPASLLDEARAARMSGHPDLERAALLACRKRAPGQPAAAQAAYLLGRASAAGEAAGWFETYLREMPQGLLAREAAGRLIESYQAAGNPTAAQSAASRYLARYPNGPHAAMARHALAAH